MKCNFCGKEIVSLHEWYRAGKCRDCYNQYQERYRLRIILQSVPDWEVIPGGYVPFNVLSSRGHF